MARTNEFLATTSSQYITRQSPGRGIYIYNNGPNTIWVCVDGPAVLNKTQPILINTGLSIDVPSEIPIGILSATANQVTGAATIVTEVP